MRKWEYGLRPVGAIGAYAPEGMRKVDWGMRNELNAERGMKQREAGRLGS